MKITIQSTTKHVHINGVPARLWVGSTDSGIPVHCFVTRIAAPRTADLVQFEHELQECVPPSAELEAYPARMAL